MNFLSLLSSLSPGRLVQCQVTHTPVDYQVPNSLDQGCMQVRIKYDPINVHSSPTPHKQGCKVKNR